MLRVLNKMSVKGLVYSSASLYLFLEVLVKLVPLLSVTVFSRSLSKVEFGNYALYISAVPLTANILSVSQVSSIKLIYLKYRNQVNLFLNSIYLSIAAATCLALVLYFLYTVAFQAHLLVLLSILAASLLAVTDIQLSYFNISFQKRKYAINYLIRNGAPYLLCIFLLVVIQWKSALAFAFSHLAVLFLLVVANVYPALSNKLSLPESLNRARYSLRLSLPVLPAALSAYVLSFSDRYMISYFFSKSQVADYTIAFTVASILTFLVLALNNVWQPYLLTSLKQPDWRKIKKMGRLYILFIVVCGASIIVVKSFLIRIIGGDDYAHVAELAGILVLANFIYFLYTLYSSLLLYYNLRWLVPVPPMVSALTNVLLNYFLLPVYGYEVAALTTLISYLLQFLLVYVICKKKLGIDLIF